MTDRSRERHATQLEILLAVLRDGRSDRLGEWAISIREGRGLLGSALVLRDGFAYAREESILEVVEYLGWKLGHSKAEIDRALRIEKE